MIRVFLCTISMCTDLWYTKKLIKANLLYIIHVWCNYKCITSYYLRLCKWQWLSSQIFFLLDSDALRLTTHVCLYFPFLLYAKLVLVKKIAFLYTLTIVSEKKIRTIQFKSFSKLSRFYIARDWIQRYFETKIYYYIISRREEKIVYSM